MRIGAKSELLSEPPAQNSLLMVELEEKAAKREGDFYEEANDISGGYVDEPDGMGR